jgi:hypothetical protein
MHRCPETGVSDRQAGDSIAFCFHGDDLVGAAGIEPATLGLEIERPTLSPHCLSVSCTFFRKLFPEHVAFGAVRKQSVCKIHTKFMHSWVGIALA